MDRFVHIASRTGFIHDKLYQFGAAAVQVGPLLATVVLLCHSNSADLCRIHPRHHPPQVLWRMAASLFECNDREIRISSRMEKERVLITGSGRRLFACDGFVEVQQRPAHGGVGG